MLAQRHPENPIEFGRTNHTPRRSIREHVHVPKQNDPFLVEVQVEMADIATRALPVLSGRAK